MSSNPGKQEVGEDDESEDNGAPHCVQCGSNNLGTVFGTKRSYPNKHEIGRVTRIAYFTCKTCGHVWK